MKKILRILMAMVLVTVTAFSLVACDAGSDPKNTKKGLSYKKEKDGDYVITSYTDDGSNVDTLDIGAILAEAGVNANVRIKKNAFSGNTTLKSIIVPKMVTEIEEGAFANMTSLETLTVPFIGRTANSDAFYNETAKAEDKAVDSARTIAHFFGKESYDAGRSITINYGKGTTTCYVPYNFNKVIVNAESDYSIPWNAFNGATFLTEVELKGKIDAIGEGAFNGAENLVKVNLPATVKVIYKDAFKGVKKLENVTFDSLMAATSLVIKEDAFKGCVSMKSFDSDVKTVVDLSKVASIEAGAFDFGNEAVEYEINNEGSITLAKLKSAFGKTKFSTVG